MIVPANFPTTSSCGFGIPEPEQQFILYGVSWEQYEAIGDALPDWPNLRMTYDDGRLELMSKSPEHNRLSRFVALLVAVIFEECNLMAGGFGDVTLKKAMAKKGLEPDECFYIANFLAVRDKKRLNLTIDPPPDLALEIDVTSSSLPRMGLYAALKVPEIWRWVGGEFRVCHLNAEGTYDESEESSALVPNFPVNELLPHLEIGRTQSDALMLRSFRQWFQQWIADRGLTS